MPDFKRLKVWQRAHQLTLAVYQATSVFPPDERYGLTSQMRRAAASIGANLAEGCGRDGDAELTRFCQIAMGSASELEYHLLLGRDLGFLEESPYSDLADGALRRTECSHRSLCICGANGGRPGRNESPPAVQDSNP